MAPNKEQDAAMTVLNKFIYYLPRAIHILLLPILWVAIGWYLGDKWWEAIGLILLLSIPFYPFIIKTNKALLFKVRIYVYVITILLFFPEHLFYEEYPLEYKNIIFYDMCFLLIADTWIFFKKDSILKS